MPLLPLGVQLPQDLSSVFSGIGTNAYNKIGQNYGIAGKNLTSDAAARGFIGGPTDYSKGRLATTQGLDIGNLEAGLGGELGNTAYQNQLSQRDFNEQEQIANEIGSAMAPSLLQQVFGGIGTVAKSGMPYLGMMGGMGTGGGGSPSLPPSLSLIPTDESGFENYGLPYYSRMGGGY